MPSESQYTHPLGRFYRSTSAVVGEAIDKSNGRALLLNGEMFYSPNCSRTVASPPPALLSVSPTSSDVTSLHQPLWWSLDTTHLAFMPLDHTYFGVFQSTFETQELDYHGRRLGFALDPAIILSWNRLEFDLKHTATILLRRAHVPNFPDVINSTLVCTGFHRNAEELRKLVSNTRSWFLYWFSKISYAIAVNISIDQEPISMAFESLDDVPQWFRTLSSSRWPQWYLSAIMSTSAVFHLEFPRVGVFLDILRPKPHQFSPEWFISFGVPVWYRWNSDSASASSSVNERFCPLAHQLQDAATILHRTPLQHEVQPWISFFEDRARRCERFKHLETEQQRQARLNRERQPPTAGAGVYEWELGLDGTYQRIAVPKRLRVEVLEDYGRNQKVYNSFLNEWDCIREMGEKDLDELERECQEDEDTEPILGRAGTPMSPVYTEPDISNYSYIPPSHPYQQTPSDSTWDLGPDVNQFEAVSILHEYCGFVPPFLPSATNQANKAVDSKVALKYTKLIGMVRIDDAYFSSPVAPHAISFLDSVIRGQNPESDLWDLAPGNRMALRGSKHIAHLKHIEPFYVFDFGQSATVPWMLAVERADVALLVCRLDKDYDDYELCQALIWSGIRLRTFASLPIATPRRPPLLPLPVRLPGHDFSPSDLTAYEDQLMQLLRIPRISRCALMSGGIVWRLAIETVSLSTVLAGPTRAVINEHIGESFPVEGTPFGLWDDVCTEQELDLICGANVCFNDNSTMVIRSWWPLARTWKEYASHPQWTENYDTMFITRTNELKSGKGQPLTPKQWRERIRDTSVRRKFAKTMDEFSKTFIESLEVEGRTRNG